MKAKVNQAFGLVLLAWILVVITAYFVVQKPWPPQGASQALGSLLDIFLGLLLTTVSGALGRRILGPLPDLHRYEALALQAGLGLGILSLVVLLVGVVGLLGSLTSWLVLLIAVTVLWRHGVLWLTNLIESRAEDRPEGILSWAAVGMVFLLLIISLAEAMAPPLKWDSLVYHLALPQQYLASGQIGFVSGNLFAGFPQLAEMHFTWAMALHKGTTAAVYGWAVGVVAVLGLAGTANRLLGSQSTWLAPAVLLSGASLWQGLAWAYVDHWVLLFGLGTFVALERYTDTEVPGWLWLAGIFIGLAASAKYTGGFLGLAAVLWLVANWFKSANRSSGEESSSAANAGQKPWNLLSDLVKITAAALLVFSPWLLKNWLTSGNPIYPFLLPGREIDALRQTFHAQGEATLELANVPVLPWLVTVLGVEGGAGFNSSIGPLYLALIPGLLFFPWDRKDRGSKFLGQAILVGLLLWLLWGLAGLLADPLSRSRHYYGFLPLLALLAAAGLQSASHLKLGEIRLGWVISRLVLFSFILVTIGAVFHLAGRNPIPVILGQQDTGSYLGEQLGWYGPTMDYMEELPAGSEVEMLWEARSYYCSRECNPDVILDKWWYWRRTVGEGTAIADHLKAQGVTHVLVYDFGAAFERRSRQLQEQADWQALEEFRADQLELVESFGDAYSLYTWKDS